MRAKRRCWMRASNEEREAVASALTIDCPFCGEPITSAAGGGLSPMWKCACGAYISRVAEPEFVQPGRGLLVAAYHEIRRRMREDSLVVGQDPVVDRLALMGARHVHVGGRQRVILVGPSGVGKTTIISALARAVGCPFLAWDVSTSSEAGWSGVDTNNAFAALYQECERDVERMETAVVCLDELCKIAIRDSTGVAREHRRGQAKSLLVLAGGGVPIRFPEHGDRGASVAVTTDNMLIVGSGAFEGLAPDPTPGDLVAYGFSVEFAGRFSQILKLASLEPAHMVTIYRRAVEEAVMTSREFGFDIEVPDAVLQYVAHAVADGGEHVTPRAGMGWLQAAVDSALLRLLDLGARHGASCRLQPDDVPIPGAVRRR